MKYHSEVCCSLLAVAATSCGFQVIRQACVKYSFLVALTLAQLCCSVVDIVLEVSLRGW